ncbi:MAG: hypothetical protein JSS23_00165 [Proteobacteria bacterium]|nr:hypothetical protein [Pseudomonadota bacterium]
MTDTIIFESIGGGSTPPPPAVGSGTLFLFARGEQGTLESLGGIGSGILRLLQHDGGPPPPPPTYGIGSGTLRILPGYAYGPGTYPPATGAGTLRLGALGYFTPNYGIGSLHLRTFAVVPPPVVPPIPPDTSMIGVNETVDVSQSLASQMTWVIAESLRLRTRMQHRSTASVSAIARLELSARYDAIYYMLVDESLHLNATVTLDALAIQRVMDALVLTGVVSSAADALAAVVVSLAMKGMADSMMRDGVTENLVMSATITNLLTIAKAIVEQLLVSAQQTNTLTMMVLASDQLALSATLSSAADAMTVVRESLALGLRLTLDTGEYVAYVLNTESKHLSRYEQFPFNSFAQIGGSGPYFGMTDGGLYTLDGPDDAGTAIASRVRLAMTNLGTSLAKRMMSGYLGYTSTGELRLKVFVMEQQVIDGVPTGVKVAHTYRLRAQPSDVPLEGRLQVGQGIKSTYWGFEIEAIDGAQFMIDLLEMVPIILDQRLTGQNGGDA